MENSIPGQETGQRKFPTGGAIRGGIADKRLSGKALPTYGIAARQGPLVQ
jgi:hypothetical protein